MNRSRTSVGMLVSLLALGCGVQPDAARTPSGLERVVVTSASSSILLGKGLCVLAADGEVQCVSTYENDARSAPEDGLRGARALVEGGPCGMFAGGSLRCTDFDQPRATEWATGVVQAQIENRYLCFVTATGGVTCRRSYGEVWELPLTQTAKQVSVSEDQVCVLLADSQVQCWSRETKSSLGTIAELSGATQIGLAQDQPTGSRPGLIWGCALVAGGEVRCWNSTLAASLTITPHDAPGEPLTTVRSLAVAGRRGCGITEDGNVHCWGNFVFNLGNDASDGAWMIPGVKGAVALTLGPRQGGSTDCALSGDGKLVCWGGTHQVGPTFGFPY